MHADDLQAQLLRQLQIANDEHTTTQRQREAMSLAVLQIEECYGRFTAAIDQIRRAVVT